MKTGIEIDAAFHRVVRELRLAVKHFKQEVGLNGKMGGKKHCSPSTFSTSTNLNLTRNPDTLHHQPRAAFKNKKTGIRQRIKSYLEGVTIDPFGHEKSVIKNVVRYLERISEQEGVPLARIFTRISLKGIDLRVYLHHNSKLLKEVPISELVQIFTGKELAEMPGIEKKVVDEAGLYLHDFAVAHNILLNQLNVLISSDGNEVAIEAYNDQKHAKYIPLAELIKHFR